MKRPLAEVLSQLTAKAPEFVPEAAYRCDLCRDKGWTVEPDGGNGTSRTCSCVTGRPVEEKLKAAGVGADLLHASFTNLRGPIADVDLSTFPEPDSCLTLMGPVGAGKSHLAVAYLRKWLEGGQTGRFIESAAFVDECRASYDAGEQPHNVIGRYLRPDLRVLDDAYSDRKTDFADEAISLLIRRCLRERAPLIITTNLTEAQLYKIEPRVCSRVTGLGAIALDFTGQPDRRKGEN
ncbi:MAG TPA: ATP-binding protein [Thermoanaerobaculia bacterium]|nr:ATP-binding protein [Thermoanaerobaculia bacterium]